MWLLHFVFKYLHGMKIRLSYLMSEFSWRYSPFHLKIVPSQAEGTLVIFLALLDISFLDTSFLGHNWYKTVKIVIKK